MKYNTQIIFLLFYGLPSTLTTYLLNKTRTHIETKLLIKGVRMIKRLAGQLRITYSVDDSKCLFELQTSHEEGNEESADGHEVTVDQVLTVHLVVHSHHLTH